MLKIFQHFLSILAGILSNFKDIKSLNDESYGAQSVQIWTKFQGDARLSFTPLEKLLLKCASDFSWFDQASQSSPLQSMRGPFCSLIEKSSGFHSKIGAPMMSESDL